MCRKVDVMGQAHQMRCVEQGGMGVSPVHFFGRIARAGIPCHDEGLRGKTPRRNFSERDGARTRNFRIDSPVL